MRVVASAVAYTASLIPLPRTAPRFVIFAQGRTGSSLLADLLNSHYAIRCEHEILGRRRVEPARYVEGRGRLFRSAYGFKVKVYQLSHVQRREPHDFLVHLHSAGWRIVHLRRRNLLRQVLSGMAANDRGWYVHHAAMGAASQPPLSVDIAELRSQLEGRIWAGEREAEALRGVPHLPLEYEQHLLDGVAHQGTADLVCDYVGVERAPVSSRVLRTGTRALPDAIANFSEVESALRGSRFERYLVEP
jgi:LPS sulfotransferase NodH